MGCGKKEASTGSDLEYIKQKGTLIVGITDFAPMDYQDADGSWIGFDADLAKAFAESLGVEVQFQTIEWDNKVMELDGKTIDVVWNGMTLTDEVTSSMACSNAYCNNAQVVILPADKAADYGTVDSLSGLRFAVESGSAGMAPGRGKGPDVYGRRRSGHGPAGGQVRHGGRRHHRLAHGGRNGRRGHELRRSGHRPGAERRDRRAVWRRLPQGLGTPLWH